MTSSSSEVLSVFTTSVVSVASGASGTAVAVEESLSDSKEASGEDDTPKKATSVGSVGGGGVASGSAAATSSEGFSTATVLDASVIVAVCESGGGAAIHGTVTCSLTASSAAETQRSG